jgi:hypothetical protein
MKRNQPSGSWYPPPGPADSFAAGRIGHMRAGHPRGSPVAAPGLGAHELLRLSQTSRGGTSLVRLCQPLRPSRHRMNGWRSCVISGSRRSWEDG